MKSPKFPRLVLQPKDGSEPFHSGGQTLQPLSLSVRDFWSWACSDLVGNSLRGLVAEYLVARAVLAERTVRVEWDAFDIETPDGIRVEVKTSGYLQSWDQSQLSTISFDIAPKRSWYSETNTYSVEAKRAAQVYVFAVHKHQDKSNADPLDVQQWEFYVLPVGVLDQRYAKQQTIRLSAFKQLGASALGFSELGDAIRAAALGVGTPPELPPPDQIPSA